MFEEADLIHRYSRADALRDGVLIDVSATAREAGIRYPVALTCAAWARCVAVPAGVIGQDEAGRLWDVLMVLRALIRQPYYVAITLFNGGRLSPFNCILHVTPATVTTSAGAGRGAAHLH